MIRIHFMSIFQMCVGTLSETTPTLTPLLVPLTHLISPPKM